MAMSHHAARDQDIGNNGWLGVGIFLHDVFRCFFTQIVAKGRRPNVPAAALQTMPMRWWLHVGMEMAVTCNE